MPIDYYAFISAPIRRNKSFYIH